jgi:signal transduction histidine kinase
VVTIHPEGEGQVLVCVEDFGIGMTEEVSSKVFDRFYRGEEDLSHTYPGLGLGLYISAGIIRQHEGKIWARSKPGQGSTFCFTLPIAG